MIARRLIVVAVAFLRAVTKRIGPSGAIWVSAFVVTLGSALVPTAVAAGDEQAAVDEQSARQPPFTERVFPINSAPDGWTILRDSYVASPDAKRVAYRVVRAVKGAYAQAVVSDNRVGRTGTIVFGPTFSPDSKRIATAVINGGRGLLDVSGRSMTRTPDPVSAPIFTPDSMHTAFVAREAKNEFVVFDGKSQLVVYDEVPKETLAFSPDSQHLAYTAKRGDAWFVVLNGQEGQAYADVSQPVFSPDSQRLAYWALKPSGLWVIVVDEQENQLVAADDQAGLWFSPDSTRLVGFAHRAGRWHAVVDNRFERGYDALGHGSVVFSPDSKHLAYGAMDGRRWKVVVDGERVGDYEALLSGSLKFSPSSKRIVFAARDDEGRWFVVEDGRYHGSYKRIAGDSIQFSPDSQRLAYVAQDETELAAVIVDGQRWALSQGVEKLAFSPDSKHIVWVAREGGFSRAYVDGVSSAFAFERMVPGASLVFGSMDQCNTVVMRRPGPVFFRLELQMRPDDGAIDRYAHPWVIGASDRDATGR